MSIIKATYPDVADEDGKRVLWMTDFHGSRFSVASWPSYARWASTSLVTYQSAQA